MADTPATDTATPTPEAAAAQSMLGMGRTQLIALGGIGILALGAFAWIIITGASGEYKVLASNLPGEDMRAATAALDSKGIPFRVDDEGMLSVPSTVIHDARLELAASAMPSGRTVGFELFDESELGRSAFAEKVNFHRALEGELARTITHFAPVSSARVHLVMPEDKLFRDQDIAPSASVHISLEPSEGLLPKQVDAIRHLVSGAVERLTPGQVTVVDEYGAMIGGPRDPELEAADGVFEHQRKFEKQLERKIVELLEPVIGVGGVQAKVSARIDYSHVVETEDRVNPEESAVVSEQTREEQRTAAEGAALGVPGAGTNLPDRNPGGAAPEQRALANKSENTVNYKSTQTSKRVDQPRGRTQQLSVAVIVDNGRVAGEDGKETITPRTEEELARYEALVSRAIGVDLERGDTIEVAAETLLKPVQGTNVASEDIAEPSAPITLYVAIGAAFLVLMGAILAVLRARKSAREKLETELRRLADIEKQRQEQQNLLNELAEPTEPRVSDKVHALRLRALTSGAEDMRRAATVIRTWLQDDEAKQLSA